MATEQASTPRYWFVSFSVNNPIKGVVIGNTAFEYDNLCPPHWFMVAKAVALASTGLGVTVTPAQIDILTFSEFKSLADYNSFQAPQPTPLM